MNILFLSELFYPHGGGAELATFLYAKLLNEKGFNVTVVTNKFQGEEDVQKDGRLLVYRVELFRKTIGVKFATWKRIDVLFSGFVKRLLKSTDIVYVPRTWFSAIPAAKAYGKPVIAHLHDYAPICPLAVLYNVSRHDICKSRHFCSANCVYRFEKGKGSSSVNSFLSVPLNLLGRWPIRLCVGLADAIVCVSSAQRQILTQAVPEIGHKARVVYNPLPDLPIIKMEGDDFAFLGGTNMLKGFGVLRKASSLDGGSSKIHVLDATDVDDRVKDFYDPSGLVFHGRLRYDDQEEFYRRIRSVVFPSIVPEPLPYVTAEAIMRGRILVASRIGGIPEQVEGCKGAFLCEPGNPFELVRAIRQVRSLKREVTIDMGYQNREVFVRRFNNERTIKDFTEIVDALN